MSEESISELVVRVREHNRITIQGGHQCVLLYEKTITRILDTIESHAAEIEEYREALRQHAISGRYNDDIGSSTGENAGWLYSCERCCQPDRAEWREGETEPHFPEANGKPCLAAPKPAESE